MIRSDSVIAKRSEWLVGRRAKKDRGAKSEIGEET